eukprot:TRINITY_DN534_c0_g1_i1.p1 TRINITY_DN534_c0_g1~~TRINITY_DN534_c0_g1_i1.p1  ORF type:complete len:231 (-),score=56.47 TRINITY_DN534_c0_g1_i1:70-762(-)
MSCSRVVLLFFFLIFIQAAFAKFEPRSGWTRANNNTSGLTSCFRQSIADCARVTHWNVTFNFNPAVTAASRFAIRFSGDVSGKSVYARRVSLWAMQGECPVKPEQKRSKKSGLGTRNQVFRSRSGTNAIFTPIPDAAELSARKMLVNFRATRLRGAMFRTNRCAYTLEVFVPAGAATCNVVRNDLTGRNPQVCVIKKNGVRAMEAAESSGTQLLATFFVVLGALFFQTFF